MNRDDAVRQQFSADSREFYMNKMRRTLGMKPKTQAPPTDVDTAQLEQAEAACTCTTDVTCTSCRDWARRMLTISQGKAP